jgi:arginase family enzyme
MLRQIALTREIVGFDVVELAPIKALSHPDFTAALLTQTLMGFTSAHCKHT